MSDARKQINDIFDPDGKAKALANQVGMSLLQTARDEGQDFVWGPAIAAIALLMADPDEDREQALISAKAFCEALTDEISEKWGELVAIRRRFDGGEFD